MPQPADRKAQHQGCQPRRQQRPDALGVLMPLGTESAPGPQHKEQRRTKEPFTEILKRDSLGRGTSLSHNKSCKLRPTFRLSQQPSWKSLRPFCFFVSPSSWDCTVQRSLWPGRSHGTGKVLTVNSFPAPEAELTALQNPDISAALARLGVQDDECKRPRQEPAAPSLH